MNSEKYLYLIKTIENNKVQLVTSINIDDGVTTSNGEICAVLKRYTPPVDMEEALSDIQKFSDSVVVQMKKPTKRSSGKIYTDHLGNEFDTVFQMCSHYKISESKYRSRLANGWTQEEALTGVRKKKQVADHLGNVFDSRSDMCQYYGIKESLFRARINAGKSVEEALLGVDEENTNSVEDHLGNKYKNISQMCKTYGVRLDSYCKRKKRGWTLEEILTGKDKSSPISDHKGNVYSDVEEMCEEYGIRKQTYLHRINSGWTVKEALIGIKEDSVVKDHLGNIYLSQKDMCESYGIKVGTFRVRLKKGFSLEDALTIDIGDPRKVTVSDHLGQSFTSLQDLCDAYNVKISTYKSRIRNGYTVEEALTGERKNVTPPKKPKKEEQKNFGDHSVTDHLGNVYSCTKEMCQAYGIRVDTFKFRLKTGKSLEDALTRTPSMVTTNIPCQDHLGNHYISQTEMARAYGLTKEQFISRKRNGWSVERILTTPINGGRSQNTFEFNGVEYTSKKEFCKKNGLNYDVFIHRTNAGLTVEQAVAAHEQTKERPRVEAIDHKGIKYPTIKNMCEVYGISVSTYKYRLSHGWSLESTLTNPQKPGLSHKVVTDHNGVSYDSVSQMCKVYNLKLATYKYRIEHGWDVETALTTPLNSGHISQQKERKPRCYDHKGIGYPSKRAMCEAYGISIYTYKKRQSDGLSLEQTLELPVVKERSFTHKDHLGVEFESLKEMCAAWGISVHTYQSRVSKGYSLEKALSEPDDSVAVTDHKGNAYPTIQSMCKAYNISVSLYTSRIKRGKSVEESLETPIEDLSVVYKGKTFSSLKDLAKKYNINDGTLRSRLKLGWTLEEAVSGVKKSRACYDHLGNEFRSQKEMCQAYGVESATYHSRIKSGWTIEQALTNITPKNT